MKISVILPVYNPSTGWADVVVTETAKLQSLMPSDEFEFIVVNDGSTNDAYRNEAQKMPGHMVRLIDYFPNKGKGEALRTGVRASTGELIMYTDIDFPYTMESIIRMIDTLRSGKADFIIGVKDRDYYKHVPPVRRFISRFFRMLIRVFFRIPTDDTQCGLKAFDEKAKSVFLKTTIDRYLFDLEFVFLASRDANIIIQTQVVALGEGVEFRKMNFGILKNESVNFLKMFFRTIISR